MHMKQDIVIFTFPEPMFRISDLDKPVKERNVYYDIIVCCPYIIDEHAYGKTYLKDCDPTTIGCNIMNECFTPVRVALDTKK